jgi:hypothetical protein
MTKGNARRATGCAITAAGLAVTVTGVLGLWHGSPDQPSTPAGVEVAEAGSQLALGSPRQSTPSVPVTSAADLPTGVALPGTSRAAVVPVGVRSDRSLVLPGISEVGWWIGGSTPAQAGATVLAGHLDDEEGRLGVLADLTSLRRGDHVAVSTLTGTTTYRVATVRLYGKGKLPLSLFARTGARRLVMITCGGLYTPGRGYADNVVVTAVPA